jgi:tRNA A-37 threonylcarbamoyl transferase component Bud32
MRKLEEAGITLNHADKQAVWKIVCPKYYKEKSVNSQKRRQRQKRQEKFNRMVKEDYKLSQPEKPNIYRFKLNLDLPLSMVVLISAIFIYLIAIVSFLFTIITNG